MVRILKTPALAAGVVSFAIGIHFAMVCVARDLAAVRARLRDHLMMPSERADRAIELLGNYPLFGAYCLTTIAILALAPWLAIIKKFQVWWPVVVALVIYLPGFLYGREVLHLSGKVIDWESALNAG